MDNLYNEEDLENYDLSLASLENLGGAITSIGYLFISLSGKKEYWNILTDSKSSPSPTELLLNGQILILIGYYILWRVASNRVLIQQIKNTNLVSSQKKNRSFLSYKYFCKCFKIRSFFRNL